MTWVAWALVLFLCGAVWLIARSLARPSARSAPVIEYELLRRVWVIDGDTIDDRATGVRYRLANIDAPETGDNARCHRERELGNIAKRVAIDAVRMASAVTAKNTFKIDRYGRRVAYVYVDGEDLGELLIRKGLAAPWAGYRKRWCGRAGQLSELAAVRGEGFGCKTCRNW